MLSRTNLTHLGVCIMLLRLRMICLNQTGAQDSPMPDFYVQVPRAAPVPLRLLQGY